MSLLLPIMFIVLPINYSLTLVVVAKESGDYTWLFQQLAHLLNALGMSCKKMRMLRIAQAEELIDALELE